MPACVGGQAGQHAHCSACGHAPRRDQRRGTSTFGELADGAVSSASLLTERHRQHTLQPGNSGPRSAGRTSKPRTGAAQAGCGANPLPVCVCAPCCLQAIYEWFDIGFDRFGRTPSRAQTQIGQASRALGAARRQEGAAACARLAAEGLCCFRHLARTPHGGAFWQTPRPSSGLDKPSLRVPHWIASTLPTACSFQHRLAARLCRQQPALPPAAPTHAHRPPARRRRPPAGHFPHPPGARLPG